MKHLGRFIAWFLLLVLLFTIFDSISWAIFENDTELSFATRTTILTAALYSLFLSFFKVKIKRY